MQQLIKTYVAGHKFKTKKGLIMASSKIRQSARGEDCTLRLYECNGNSETVVLCHIGRSRGMGFKCGDHFAVYACSSCHDVIDNRVTSKEVGFNKDRELLRALEETQLLLINKGLLKI